MKTAAFRISIFAILLAVSMEACAGIREAEDDYAKRNYKALLQELRPLVNRGNAEAMFYVGLLFDEGGEGIKQDYNKAKAWYLRAAKLGYAPAQTNLGWVLQMGTSTELSDKEAAKWYLKAADQGYAPAQYDLGLMYYAGRGGIPKDEREAAGWFRKAAEQGYAPAQNGLAKMYRYSQGVMVSLVQAEKWFTLAAESGDEAYIKNKQEAERMMAPEMIVKGRALAQEWLAQRRKTASN